MHSLFRTFRNLARSEWRCWRSWRKDFESSRIFSVLCLLVSFASIANVLGVASIQRNFAELEGYNPALREEISSFESLPSVGLFETPILKEAGLLSYSSWSLSSRNLSLTVYELEDSSGAFSLFTLYPDRAGQIPLRSLELPVGNFLAPSQGAFWRGNYFFLVSPSQGNLNEKVFRQVVNDFVDAVRLENLLPVSVTHLPEVNLEEASLRFYLGARALELNEDFPEPLLEQVGFTDRIEIAFGRYSPGDDALFVVGYPTPDLAEEYFFELQNELQGYFSDQGIFMKRSGVLIGIFIGPEVRAVPVLTALEYSPSIKWLYEENRRADTSEVQTFFGLLTQTILGIGFFLVAILGAGFVAGLARYGFISRFPSLTRRKEMVRLDLE